MALEEAFESMDNHLLSEEAISRMQELSGKKDNKNPSTFTGTTAHVAILTENKIIVANCGDSRSALYTNLPGEGPSYIELSVDHKPDDKQ